MHVVLFRHGIAVKRDPNLDDGARPLTDQGRKKVHDAAEFIKQQMQLGDICIWHSPLLRSRQTAEILRQALNVSGMQRKEWIASGKSTSVLADLHKEMGHGKDKTIVIVGHAPHLDEWCKLLCGVALHLKKGAAACIRMDDECGGELVWLIQPRGWEMLV